MTNIKRKNGFYWVRARVAPEIARYDEGVWRLFDQDEPWVLELEVLSERIEHYGKWSAPVPMLLWCPTCGHRHIDTGEFATKPHHTHACQNCGMTWRPAIVATTGVRFLPGFKNDEPPVVGTPLRMREASE